MTTLTPYVDVSINADWADWQHYPEGRPNPIYSNTTANGLILAFISLSPENKPCWAQQPTMTLDWALPLAKELKAAGKTVGISFGGAAGKDISTALSVEELDKTYNQLTESYQLDHLDFDLENGLYDIDKICAALKIYCPKNPIVLISFTLPVLPTGLVATGLEIIEKAKDAGITFTVNGMAMDYYQEEWKNKMGDAAVEVVKSLKGQMKTLYPSLPNDELFSRVGVTPMIGLNDDLSMFTLADTKKVGTFSKQNDISFTSFWSLNRDNPSSFSYVDLQTSSNPEQKDAWEYTTTFMNAPK